MELIRAFRAEFLKHRFIRVKGRFAPVEMAYVYMIIACMILAYGTLHYQSDWRIIPFLIPFLIGFHQLLGKIKVKEDSGKIRRFLAKYLNPYLFSKVEEIDELAGAWRTQLYLLSDSRMSHKFNTPYDFWLEEHLRVKWFEYYGEPYDDMVKWSVFPYIIVSLLLIGVGLVVAVY
jgi:hypothetical protein